MIRAMKPTGDNSSGQMRAQDARRPGMSRIESPRRERGSTLLIVLWTLGLATLMVLSLQVSAHRQAVSGRDALGKVRARWAARAGVEACIAYLAWESENAEDSDPVKLKLALEDLSEDELNLASYRIEHAEGEEMVPGPMDAHARFNVNLMSSDDLMKLDSMTEDVAAAIMDWVDSDDEARDGGAEGGFYLQESFPYEPRNAPAKSLLELELVKNVDPELLRGEDWNLNGVLDANEDDGDLSLPGDDADLKLDAGWSALITAASQSGGLGISGEPKLDLAAAEDSDIRQRLRVDSVQAAALSAYGKNTSNRFENLIAVRLSQVNSEGAVVGAGGQGALGARDLSQEQMRTLLADAMIGNPALPRPGKVNINTAALEVLELIPGFENGLADQVEFARQARSFGFESIMDLLELRGMTSQRLAALAPYIDVRSNVYVISSRGIAQPGRTMVEMSVTIDRSGLPITILNYLER